MEYALTPTPSQPNPRASTTSHILQCFTVERHCSGRGLDEDGGSQYGTDLGFLSSVVHPLSFLLIFLSLPSFFCSFSLLPLLSPPLCSSLLLSAPLCSSLLLPSFLLLSIPSSPLPSLPLFSNPLPFSSFPISFLSSFPPSHPSSSSLFSPLLLSSLLTPLPLLSSHPSSFPPSHPSSSPLSPSTSVHDNIDATLVVFIWSCGTPDNREVFIGMFDINRWYHAQMPNLVRWKMSGRYTG